jgi:hypothetical protein
MPDEEESDEELELEESDEESPLPQTQESSLEKLKPAAGLSLPEGSWYVPLPMLEELDESDELESSIPAVDCSPPELSSKSP